MAKEKIPDPEEVQAKKSAAVRYWINEIYSAKKRERDYRKEGSRILEIYHGEKPDQIPFNILYSNTETLSPALYSALPRPIVRRRYKDDDPLGHAAAKAGQRCLEFLLDTNVDGYETFDEGMKAVVLDGLLPGRGVSSIKYDADIIDEEPTESINEDEPSDNGSTDDNNVEPNSYKKSELVCVDTRSWNKVYFGYAKKWSKVPWVCYEENIDREEATRLFGNDVAAKLKYTVGIEKDHDEDDSKQDNDDRDVGERKTTLIYQIWDKNGGRKIRYVSEQMVEDFLKVEDDPLQLTGFFNCPRPLKFIEKVNDLIPVSIYKLYENQAKELNRLTARINRIIEAIKARGAYDSELGDDLKNIMQSDDNELVPADKSSSLAAEKGLDNAIWFMPIEKLITVLQQLYIAREACKQVIYEITGIADVMRGQSKASETLGAQEIKTQWGTLRIKPKQGEVARYCRDILRMMLEVAATKFSEETWAKMTGLPYLTQQQKMQAVQMLQALKQQAQIMMMQQTQQAPQTAQPGQPPQQAQQPQLPPELQQQIQQVQAQLQQPTWQQILELLSTDMQRAYRIDIETNSTLEPEAAEDKKNISEFMTAMGQFLNGVGPLVAQGVMPFQVAQTMLLTIARRFRFGDEIEDEIKQMKPPEQDNKAEQMKLQMEQQKSQQESQQKQAELAMKQKEHDMKMQQEQLRAQTEAKRQQAEQSRIALEMVQAQKEHDFKMEEMASKHRVNMETGRMKMEQMKNKTQQAGA